MFMVGVLGSNGKKYWFTLKRILPTNVLNDELGCLVIYFFSSVKIVFFRLALIEKQRKMVN